MPGLRQRENRVSFCFFVRRTCKKCRKRGTSGLQWMERSKTQEQDGAVLAKISRTWTTSPDTLLMIEQEGIVKLLYRYTFPL